MQTADYLISQYDLHKHTLSDFSLCAGMKSLSNKQPGLAAIAHNAEQVMLSQSPLEHSNISHMHTFTDEHTERKRERQHANDPHTL